MPLNNPATVGSTGSYVLTADGPEAPGVLHAITGYLVEQHADIVEIKQFDDMRAMHYFVRVEYRITEGFADPGLDEMRRRFEPVAERLQLRFDLVPSTHRQRVLIMVSKFEHCLTDLLFRARIGELPIEIVAVVSNHTTHRSLSEWHGVPFFHIPVTPENKPEAEQKLLDLVDRFEVDLVVLARYMQILSEQLSDRMEGRVINIHHSFLPSFKGAKPYHQAYARGVKTVGATAHYVTSDLDEGPIIAQQVQHVDHAYSPEDLVAAGRDTESKALSDAVRWHAEGRVILHDGRTVVLL
ncbi:MAG: formyltetrahydrofolate deformylase [Dermatophilus congolensis]|nr:formyltetrahydrofolate deformylase [Dermatophilus congolensis]